MKPMPRQLKLSQTLDGRIMAAYSPDGITEYAGYAYNDMNAIIELAEAIKKERYEKTYTPKTYIGEWAKAMERAMNQPQQNTSGIFRPEETPERPEVGRIVWYWPIPGEIEDHKGGPISAIVTKVLNGWSINVHLFLDKEEVRFITDVHHGTNAGNWGWPVKKVHNV